MAAGLMEARPNSEHKGQNEHVLPEKGRDFVPALVALTSWGDRWAAPDGPPIVYEHQGCGEKSGCSLRCSVCDQVTTPAAVTARPGASHRSRGSLAHLAQHGFASWRQAVADLEALGQSEFFQLANIELERRPFLIGMTGQRG